VFRDARGYMCEAKPTNHTRPFLLVSSQRSGSTWLIDSLSSLPCLALQREMFLLHGNARVSCSTRERERPFAVQCNLNG